PCDRHPEEQKQKRTQRAPRTQRERYGSRGESFASVASSAFSFFLSRAVTQNGEPATYPSNSPTTPAAAASAPSSAPASDPPASARSGLPPPLPPTFAASRPTIFPACTFAVRSLVTPTISETFPSAAAPSTTTPDPSFPRSSSTRLRICDLSRASTRCASTFTPLTSTAEEAASAVAADALFIRRASSSRRSFRISSSCADTFAFSASALASPPPTNCEATRATSASLRKSPSEPVPVTASTRLTPLATALSPTSLTSPISPVAAVCVPPQSSVEKSPIFTTRTRSPYFSPNSAIAPYSWIATSIGTSTIVCTAVFAST